jgi:hypothetical protein
MFDRVHPLRTTYRRPVRWERREQSLECIPDDDIVRSDVHDLELMPEQSIRHGKLIG